jgi:hypothetical protein
LGSASRRSGPRRHPRFVQDCPNGLRLRPRPAGSSGFPSGPPPARRSLSAWSATIRLEPRVALLELFEPLGDVGLHPALLVCGQPARGGLLAGPSSFAAAGMVGPSPSNRFGVAPLADELLRCVPASLHRRLLPRTLLRGARNSHASRTESKALRPSALPIRGPEPDAVACAAVHSRKGLAERGETRAGRPPRALRLWWAPRKRRPDRLRSGEASYAPCRSLDGLIRRGQESGPLSKRPDSSAKRRRRRSRWHDRVSISSSPAAERAPGCRLVASATCGYCGA